MSNHKIQDQHVIKIIPQIMHGENYSDAKTQKR